MAIVAVIKKVVVILISFAAFLPFHTIAIQPDVIKPEVVKLEREYNTIYCQRIGGKEEVSHNYSFNGHTSHVRVDCETDQFVIEGGLDKRTSLDSVQQVLFFALISKKKPKIVIFDTDGKLGIYEYRIKSVADRLKIDFESFPKIEKN